MTKKYPEHPRHSSRLLKPLERAIASGHPWVYGDAMRPIQAEPGDIVSLYDRKRRFLARGLAESGPIALRLLTTTNEPLNAEFFALRIQESLALRDQLPLGDSNALRLIHGEGDRLPGLVCDQYAQAAVIKWDGQALLAWRDEILDALIPALKKRGLTTVIERSGRGADKRAEILMGDKPEGPVQITEWGMKLWVDLLNGQKTGMFLDHRRSRKTLRELSQDKRVLNLFSYSGGFSVSAGLGEAKQVVSVDSAGAAIELAERNWRDNGLDPSRHQGFAQEVQPYLQGLGAQQFDLIISDPPSFAPNHRVKEAALKAYYSLHRAAIHALEAQGLLLAASCSSHVNREDFVVNLRDALRGEKRTAQILGQWGADFDHPVPAGFPEGEYLKVVLLRVY